MGWPIYVYNAEHVDYGSYHDVEHYAGTNIFKAAVVMFKLKRAGAKSITLEWRP